LIALEKLNIAGMVRGHFSKSILDVAWGELLGQLASKAEEAGKFAVAVDPQSGHCEARASPEVRN
jgi:IS605 OrfB family transposase